MYKFIFVLLLCFGQNLVFAEKAGTRANGSKQKKNNKDDQESSSTRPNLMFILADDLGFNDVSWHNPAVSMPSLSKLAGDAVILDNHYTNPICTPSRSAFITGKYPFHIGRHYDVLKPLSPTGLSINHTTLPQELVKLGYQTHMVGKWHLGYCAPEYLPTRRGFQTFLGMWAGNADYYTHARAGRDLFGAYDFFDGETVAREYENIYSTNIYGDRTVEILNEIGEETKENPDDVKPFFIYLPFQTPHSPIQPTLESFRNINKTANQARDVHGAMVLDMDIAIGKIVQALKDNDLYDNTIIVFTSDNGASIKHGGSNWPLRGGKNTLWEGGTRVPTFVHAPSLLDNSSYINERMMHMTDWMPTFLKLAGFKGNATKQLNLDGVNQWNTISNNKKDSRTELVYNIKDDEGAIRVGDYKLLYGKPSLMGWYKSDIMPVKCLKWMNSVPPTKGVNKIKLKQKFSQAWDNRFESKYRREYRRWMRENGAIAPRNIRTDDCSGRVKLVEIIHRPNRTLESLELNIDDGTLDDDDESGSDQKYLEPEEPRYNSAQLEKLKFVNWTEILETSPIYLFNLRTDPLETDNLAERHPDIVQQLKNRLLYHTESITLPDSIPEDRRGHPKNFNNNLGTGWCIPK